MIHLHRMRTWRFSKLQLVHCRRPSHSVYERQSDEPTTTGQISSRYPEAQRYGQAPSSMAHRWRYLRCRRYEAEQRPATPRHKPTPDKSRPFESRHSAVITLTSFNCAGAHQPMTAAVVLVCHCAGKGWRLAALTLLGTDVHVVSVVSVVSVLSLSCYVWANSSGCFRTTTKHRRATARSGKSPDGGKEEQKEEGKGERGKWDAARFHPTAQVLLQHER